MSENGWKPIETAPKDGRVIWVKRVYDGRVIKESEAVFDWPHPQAPLLELHGVAHSASGSIAPAYYSNKVKSDDKLAITKRWMIPNRLLAFPEPTHWMPLP